MSEAVIYSEIISSQGKFQYLLSNSFFDEGDVVVVEGKGEYKIINEPIPYCDDIVAKCGYIYEFDKEIKNAVGKRVGRK